MIRRLVLTDHGGVFRGSASAKFPGSPTETTVLDYLTRLLRSIYKPGEGDVLTLEPA